jgi:hypothetical protein
MKQSIPILILFILILTSCNHQLQSRDYKSIDIYTGGFNDFSLHLGSTGLLRLKLTTSVIDSENSAGTFWSRKTELIDGKWNYKNGNIETILMKSKSEIDRIFYKADRQEFLEKPILKFSHNLDTAYIYGIPCLLQKKTLP